MEWNRDMEAAPKDGTLLLLLLAPDDQLENALEDCPDETRTIGFNSLKHTKVDIWEFAGWDWEQDCFVDGKGTPVAWMLFPSFPGMQR